MIDTAIIGGGLCGLSLAHTLQQQGQEFLLFEARERLGGRVLSVPGAAGETPIDMGPTWFWPDINPRMTRLVESLGLAHFAQADEGELLTLRDPDKAPTTAVQSVHGGARRVEGGMARLTDALAARLPAERLKTSHVLGALTLRGDHVELTLHTPAGTLTQLARRVVLAVPPRLLVERVTFTPELDDALIEAMLDTPTWMAAQAKAALRQHSAFWREQGRSGNAFVEHEQAVLYETWDASNLDGTHAALAGFVALTPAQRESFRVGLKMLVGNQLVQLFGAQAEAGESHAYHFHDWSTEQYTCSTLDLTPPIAHPEYGNPLLTQPAWGERLYFGSAETARDGGGYLEGALASAQHIALRIVPDRPGASAPIDAQNHACIARFRQWLESQRAQAGAHYRRHVHECLAAPDKAAFTRRALRATVDEIYDTTLQELGTLPFAATAPGANGRSPLTPAVLASFAGFNKQLLDDALLYNRSSCAISNFPEEHEPPREYLDDIAQELASAWQGFAARADRVMLSRKH